VELDQPRTMPTDMIWREVVKGGRGFSRLQALHREAARLFKGRVRMPHDHSGGNYRPHVTLAWDVPGERRAGWDRSSALRVPEAAALESLALVLYPPRGRGRVRVIGTREFTNPDGLPINIGMTDLT
jgi:hypothetical protein